MPRPLRLIVPGAIYHITARGNNGEAIFHASEDHRAYLHLLARIRQTTPLRIYAYVLMTNHVHLVVSTPGANLSPALQWMHGNYASSLNHLRGRSGHLFGGRFLSYMGDTDEYLLEVTRYVHLNPVRAGLARQPDEYRWSSYRAYLGQEEDGTLVDARPVLEMMAADPQRARAAYASFVGAFLPQERERLVGGPTDNVRKSAQRVMELMNLHAYEFRNGLRAAESRGVALYLAREVTAMSYPELGSLLGLKASTVGNAIASVRSRSATDPGLRRTLETLRAEFSVDPTPQR